MKVDDQFNFRDESFLSSDGSNVDGAVVLAGDSSALEDHKDGFVFVYSGQGSQWIGMGQELIRNSQAFREALEGCDRLLQSHQDWSVLQALIEPPSNEDAWLRPEIVARLIFAIQIALTALLESKGIKPIATIGHSVGSIAAAYTAGAFTLNEAVKILVSYTELLQDNEAIMGGMLAVKMSEKEVLDYCDKTPEIFLAGVMDKKFCIIAGPKSSLDKARQGFVDDGVYAALIKVNVMAHSPYFQAIYDDLVRSFIDLQTHKTTIPYFCSHLVSEIDGTRLDAVYWGDNLCKKFDFYKTILHVLGKGYRKFIEISPSPTLLKSISNNILNIKGASAWSSLDPTGDADSILSKISSSTGRIKSSIDSSTRLRKNSEDDSSVLGADRESDHTAGRSEGDAELMVKLAELPLYEKKILIHEALYREIYKVLSLDQSFELKDDHQLSSLGLTSLLGLKLKSNLEEITNINIPATLAYTCPTVGDLHNFLCDKLIVEEVAEDKDEAGFSDSEIAEKLRQKMADLGL